MFFFVLNFLILVKLRWQVVVQFHMSCYRKLDESRFYNGATKASGTTMMGMQVLKKVFFYFRMRMSRVTL